MLIFHRFLEWLGKRLDTVILIPHPIAIGNCGEEIYFGLLKARREKKKLLVILPYPLPGRLRLQFHNNRALLELQTEYRSRLQDSFWYGPLCWGVTLYFAFFRAISIVTTRLLGITLREQITIPMVGQEVLWQPQGTMKNFSWDVVNAYDWTAQMEAPVDISLSESQQKQAHILRRDMGLPADAWFVCLHVREGGYYSDHDSSGSRNATIANYFEAIKEITRRGGWVVRMGDASMTRLPQMERVIDYPFTAAKSAMMDLYLIKECRFYIGMLSGILDLAMLFQRPMLVVNMCSWLLAFPPKRSDLGLFKHVYSKKLKRFLSPFEWPRLAWGGHSTFSPEEEYEFHENTPEELRAVVVEYLDRPENWVHSPLQKEFNALRINGARELLRSEFNPGDNFADMLARYRLASRLESVQGTLGAGFLEQIQERHMNVPAQTRSLAN